MCRKTETLLLTAWTNGTVPINDINLVKGSFIVMVGDGRERA